MEKTAQVLGSLPELRLCTSVTGPQNLLLTVWLASLADVGRVEALLAERLPQLHLVDRSVALRQVKLMGRLIDEQGAGAECVPIAPWLPPRETGQPT